MTGICPTCNVEKDRYYGEWCPLCEKPEPITRTVMNFIKACRHIDRKIYGVTDPNIDPPGKQRVWHWLCDYHGLTNDVTIGIDFADILEDYTSSPPCDGGLAEDSLKYIENLVNEFNLYDHSNMQWEISW